MTVIENNFFRLLRIGLFHKPDPIEPLSPWKWRRLYQLSLMHNVAGYLWQGIQQSQDDFFVSLIPQELKEKWAKTVVQPDEPDEEEHTLTNPLLDHKLQAIIDKESAKEETPTRILLLNIVRHARTILNEGVSLPQLIDMALMVKKPANGIDYDKLNDWVAQLYMQPMADLLGTLLVQLFEFQQEVLPFMRRKQEKIAQQLTEELFDLDNASTDEWYFSQKEDQIFVRTHNSRAMFWHVGHSARYSRLYPSEAITNFFSSFAKSLTHIEE